MNELYLYELFRNILAQSTVMDGRLVIAEGYGNDLNANSFDNYITDALGGITTPRKYPAAVLCPPQETVKDRDLGWSVFHLRMYFLTTTYHDGLADIKGIAGDTNTSTHQIMHDWKDMRECAGNFRQILNKLVLARTLSQLIREVQNSPDVYERYSLMNNDRVSGVCMSFDMQLFTGCAISSEYPSTAAQDVLLPSTNIHPLHQQ